MLDCYCLDVISKGNYVHFFKAKKDIFLKTKHLTMLSILEVVVEVVVLE